MGLMAYKHSWTRMGPWDMGDAYRWVAALSVLGSILLLYIGFQPPNEKAFWITLGSLLVTAAIWFGYERRRFVGPPVALTGRPSDLAP
jgi:hypothetical protein